MNSMLDWYEDPRECDSGFATDIDRDDAFAECTGIDTTDCSDTPDRGSLNRNHGRKLSVCQTIRTMVASSANSASACFRGRRLRSSIHIDRNDREQADSSDPANLHHGRGCLTDAPRDYSVDTNMPCEEYHVMGCIQFRVMHALIAMVYIGHICAIMSLGYNCDERDSVGFPIYTTTLSDDMRSFSTGPVYKLAVTQMVVVLDCLVLLGVLAVCNFVWFSSLCMSKRLWRKYTDSIDTGQAFHRIYVDFVCSSVLTVAVMLSSGVCLLDTLLLSCVLVFSATLFVVYRIADPDSPPRYTVQPSKTTVAAVMMIHLVPIAIGLYVIGLEGHTPIRYGIVLIRGAYIAWMCYCVRQGQTLSTGMRIADIPLRMAVTLSISWLIFVSHYSLL